MADKNQNEVVVTDVKEEKPGLLKKAGNLVKAAATSKVGLFAEGVATGVLGTLGVQKITEMNSTCKAFESLTYAEFGDGSRRGTRREDFR